MQLMRTNHCTTQTVRTNLLRRDASLGGLGCRGGRDSTQILSGLGLRGQHGNSRRWRPTPTHPPSLPKKTDEKEHDRATKRQDSMDFAVNANEELGTQSSAKTTTQGEEKDQFIPTWVGLSCNKIGFHPIFPQPPLIARLGTCQVTPSGGSG